MAGSANGKGKKPSEQHRLPTISPRFCKWMCVCCVCMCEVSSLLLLEDVKLKVVFRQEQHSGEVVSFDS